MIKNEIYNELTERQLKILEEVLEGRDVTNKDQRSEAVSDLFMMNREENFLEPNGISCEYEEDLNEVERYLKSLGDNTVRTENLLKDVINQKEIYSDIGKGYDFFKVIHSLGQTYGFSDVKVETIAETVGFIFKE